MPAHNLPPQSTPFVGRQPELAEIRNLLANSECRLLTLVGPGGIGKTRLALEATRQITCPDGVYFVPLQPLTSADFIVPTIADTVSFQFYSGGDPKQQLLDYLREKSLLLLLDNFEHLLEGVSIIADILAYAPDVKIVATSRERLNLREEWVLNIEGLPFPASDTEIEIDDYSAVQLFRQHAQRVQVGFSMTQTQKSAVAGICRMVGGMPLAIELAAAWVRALSCEQIADELASSLDILETSTRNVEPRHRNMRAVFEPTWKQLTEAEQTVFKKLSVFHGGFAREAAEYVAGASLRTLTALVDKSLLRVDASGRYDIHELLRQYGEERLNASPDEAAQSHDLHCTYYADFMQQQWLHLTGSRVKEALNEIERELGNVRACWQWAIEQKKSDEIDKALDSIWLFYDARGLYQECEQMCGRVAAMLRTLNGEKAALLARTLFCQAWSCHDTEKEKVLLDESLVIARRVNARREIALALLRLGVNSTSSHRANSEDYRECLALFQEVGDDWGVGSALQMLCYGANVRGDYEIAWEYGYESLAHFSKTGNPERIAAARDVLSAVALYSENYEEARNLALESFRLAEEMGIQHTMTSALTRLAIATLELGNQQTAGQYAAQSLQIAWEGRMTYYILHALAVFERIFTAHGQLEKALEIASLMDCEGERSAITRRSLTPYGYPARNGELSLEVYAAAIERGKTLNLDEVVKELLADWSQLESDEAVSANVLSESGFLTQRELEILQLIADGLSNREIAVQLFISVNTVKWYMTGIFGKLYVNSRTQAVARAKVLCLLN